MSQIGIEIRIAKVIGQRRDSPGRMVKGFLKSPVLGPVGVAISQVPLPKMARGISGFNKIISHGGYPVPNHGTPLTHRDGTISHSIHSSQQLAPGWCAHRSYMKVNKSYAFTVEFIHSRSFKHRISVTAVITIALVVG